MTKLLLGPRAGRHRRDRTGEEGGIRGERHLDSAVGDQAGQFRQDLRR